MKIAYIISSDIARFRGSTIKVGNQARAWRKHGSLVEIFSLTPDNAPALIETVRFVKRSNPLTDKLFPYSELVEKVKEFNPDILYFRYSLPNATFKILQKNYPSVIEINTDDKEEYKKLYYERGGIKNFLLWQMNNIQRSGFLSRAEGLITVTRELSKRKSFTCCNNNISVIPNSTPMNGESIKCRGIKESPVKLFFIGSPGLKWHGTEKLQILAEKYPKEIEVHIVGIEGRNKENIFWYGYLQENEYLEILKNCNICVGTLALYEKGLDEACPLKVREYMNYGFPVILGYKDTAFLKDTPEWVLEIANNKDSFNNASNLVKIYNFCIKYRNYIVPKEEAASYIDSSVIEVKRLKILEEICNSQQ